MRELPADAQTKLARDRALLRQVVKWQYAATSPAFALVTWLLAPPGPSRDWATAAILVLGALGFLSLHLPSRLSAWNALYPVALAPAACCGTAVAASGIAAAGLLPGLVVPVAWASVLLPRGVVWVAGGSATLACFLAVAVHAGPFAGAASAAITAVIAAFTASSAGRRGQQDFAAQEALNQSAETLQALFGSVDDLITVSGPDGKLLFTNAALQRRLGFSAADLAGMQLLDLRPAGRREEAALALESFGASAARVGRLPVPLATRDGQVVDVETRAWKGSWNGQPCLFCASSDLTAEHEAQQAFERLFASSARATALTTIEDRRFVDVNPAFLDLLGLSAHEVVGKTGADLQLFADPAQALELEARLAVSDRVDGFEVRLRHRDGSLREGVLYGERVSWKGRDHHLTILTDVTRERAEGRAREEAARRVETILQSLQSGVMVVDARTHEILDVNRAAAAMLGEDRARLLGRRCRDLLCGEQPSCAAAGEPCVCVERRLRQGELQVLVTHDRVVLDGRDCQITSFVDITAQKQNEQALQESRDRLDLALASARMGVWHWSLRDDVLGLDDSVRRLLGLAEQTGPVSPAGFLAALHPEDAPLVRDALRRAIDEQAPLELECRAVWPDGSLHDLALRGRLVRDAAGAALRLDGVLWDDSERKRAQVALSESEERFRQLADVFPETIFETDLTGRLTFANQHGFSTFEATPADLERGLNLIQLVTPEDRPAILLRMRERLEGLTGAFIEYRAMTLSGRVFHAIAHSSRMMRRGKLVGLRGFVLDITERKQAEARLRAANQQLEEATARANQLASEAQAASVAKSKFLANVSHEFRLPINEVIGTTGLLLDAGLQPHQVHCVETVRTNAEKLLRMINDILDFSKMEAGKLVLEELEFDPRQLLDEFLDLLSPRAREKRLELLGSAAAEVPARVRGDAGRLRQVLANLGGNAVKFTPSGEVSVRAQVESQTASEVVLRFVIHDSGIGIPETQQGHLFEQFSRVQADEYGGTGLGLATARQIVEAMGGRIGLRSQEGRGSEFWFTCRFQKVEADRPTTRQLAGTRVLVVDDSATSRRFLRGQLEEWGALPKEAPDAETALACARAAAEAGEPFAVALLDMLMPQTDGIVLGRSFQADPRLAATRLVLMTSEERQERRLEEDGFVCGLSKPVRSSDLLECLLAAVRGQPRPRARTGARPRAELRRDNVRVLLAEDSGTNQQVALGILRKAGVAAEAVANGAEVLQALRTLPYHLVLMDLEMPEMDGISAAKAIRSAAAGAANTRVPIIALTSHASRSDRERCVAAGMDDYLTKPVSAESLTQMVDKWIARLGGGAPTSAARPPAPMPAVEPTAELPAFDEADLLERVGGDRELARLVATTFAEELPRQLAQLEAVPTDDLQALREQAHQLKGAAASAGARALQAAAQKVEFAARDGEGWRARVCVGAVREQATRATEALRVSPLLRQGP